MHYGRIEFDPITATTSHQILGPSVHRRYLTVYAPAVGTVTLSNDGPAVAGQGITLSAGMAPLYFDWDTHGDCIGSTWFAIYGTGASGLSWIQTLCFERGSPG